MDRTNASVGIFWIDSQKGNRVRIFADKVSLEDAETYGNHRVHPLGHYHLWSKIQKKNPGWNGMLYEDIPRGRVVWSDGIFFIYVNKIAKSKRIQSAILKEFGITENFRLNLRDEHYRLIKI